MVNYKRKIIEATEGWGGGADQGYKVFNFRHINFENPISIQTDILKAKKASALELGDEVHPDQISITQKSSAYKWYLLMGVDEDIMGYKKDGCLAMLVVAE